MVYNEKQVDYKKIIEYLKLRKLYLQKQKLKLMATKEKCLAVWNNWTDNDERELLILSIREKEVNSILYKVKEGKKHFSLEQYTKRQKHKLDKVLENYNHSRVD